MKIFVFGNEDLEEDNLPLRILPKLKEKFSNIQFEVKDPNEEWEVPEELTIIDTVVYTSVYTGVLPSGSTKEVSVFDDLEQFAKVPRLSMHDFDALTNLRFLQKLGKIKKVKIIAVPQGLSEDEAVEAISKILI